MKQREILDKLLKLPDASWFEEDDIKREDPVFQSSFKLLVRKRKFLEQQLERINQTNKQL